MHYVHIINYHVISMYHNEGFDDVRGNTLCAVDFPNIPEEIDTLLLSKNY